MNYFKKNVVSSFQPLYLSKGYEDNTLLCHLFTFILYLGLTPKRQVLTITLETTTSFISLSAMVRKERELICKIKKRGNDKGDLNAKSFFLIRYFYFAFIGNFYPLLNKPYREKHKEKRRRRMKSLQPIGKKLKEE